MLDWTTGTGRWNTAHSLIEKVMIRAHYFKIKRLVCQTTHHHILEKKKSRSPLFVDRISPTSAPSSKGRQKSASALCTIGKRNLIELLILSWLIIIWGNISSLHHTWTYSLEWRIPPCTHGTFRMRQPSKWMPEGARWMTTTMSSFTKIPENLGSFLEHELGGCLRSVKQLSKLSQFSGIIWGPGGGEGLG